MAKISFYALKSTSPALYSENPASKGPGEGGEIYSLVFFKTDNVTLR